MATVSPVVVSVWRRVGEAAALSVMVAFPVAVLVLLVVFRAHFT